METTRVTQPPLRRGDLEEDRKHERINENNMRTQKDSHLQKYRCKDIKQTRAELRGLNPCLYVWNCNIGTLQKKGKSTEESHNILIKYSYFYASLLPRFLLSEFLGWDNSAWALNPRPADRILLTDLQTLSSSSLHHLRHRNIKHTSPNTCDSALTRDI